MSGISYTNWQIMSDMAIEKAIGHFVRAQRQQQKKTQAELAAAANISRSTLSLLERGETVTIATLIQVLRVLGQLHVFGNFEVRQQVSPLMLAELEQKKIQRVRTKKKNNTATKSDW